MLAKEIIGVKHPLSRYELALLKKKKTPLRDTIKIQVNCLKSFYPNFALGYPSSWEFKKEQIPTKTPLNGKMFKYERLINYDMKEIEKNQSLMNKSMIYGNEKNYEAINRYDESNHYSNKYTISDHVKMYNRNIPKSSNMENQIKRSSVFQLNKKYIPSKQFSTTIKKDSFKILDLNSINFKDHININDNKNNVINNESNKSDINNKENFNEEDNFIVYSPQINWKSTVLESSIPVVVYCYADWCSPCKKLFPMVKKKFNDQKNFKLVKIDIDQYPELNQSLAVSTIPAVFLIYKGKVIDNFVGIPNNVRLEEFYNNINILDGYSKKEDIFQTLLMNIENWINKGDYSHALNLLKEANSQENWKKQYGYLIKLAMSICYFNLKDYNSSNELIKEIQNFNSLELKKDLIAFKKSNLLKLKLDAHFYIQERKDEKTIDSLVEETKNNPNDLETRYYLCEKLIIIEDFTNAINELLDIVKRNPNWENKKASKKAVELFNSLGNDNTFVSESRKKLSKIMF